MPGPVVAPAGPIPPPVLQLPWGTVGPGGMVTLTAEAYGFLQLLWSSIQGQGGIIDVTLANSESPGLVQSLIESALAQDGRAAQFDGGSVAMLATLRKYIDDLVPMLIAPPPLQRAAAGSASVTATLISSQALAAKDLVNVWNDGSAFHVRKADATAAIGDIHECHGFVNSAYASGDAVTIQFAGKISGLAGLTPGPAYLGTAGATTSTPNSTAGQTSQQVGVADAVGDVIFQPMPVVGL